MNLIQRYYKRLRLWEWVAILFIILLAAIVRIRLLDVPLERDEGEYAYMGQLILQGGIPYKDAYSMKMPGIYLMYALIMLLFGQTYTGIHLGLLLVNSATIILIFLLGKRLFNPLTGIISAASFAILSLGRSVQGLFANAEHFVILFTLVALLLLVSSVGRRKPKTFFLSGLLFGMAFLMKQHSGIFILFAALYILIKRTKGLLPFFLGAAIPFGLTCLTFFLIGIFDKFWFWTFTYAREYISSVPFITGLSVLNANITKIIKESILIWAFAGFGLASLLRNKEMEGERLFTEAFFISSFISICPGLYFRRHYFILILPVIALLSGIGISSIAKTKKIIPIFLAIIVLSYSLYNQRLYLFRLSPDMVSRATYGLNPFVESLDIAKYIKDRTQKDDRICVLGSEPQIYFYSGRRSATAYIYTYPLMERHRFAFSMQKEMIEDIEMIRPKYMVYVNVPTSWLMRKESEMLLFDWFWGYCQKYYRHVGVINIPHSKYWVGIYELLPEFKGD